MTETAFGHSYPVASVEDARALRAYRNARYRDLINTDAAELPTSELNARLSGFVTEEASA
jgi:hypothetical protein